MGEKQCGKCGETVDEAKAFCPGCGNAFEEEKRRTTVSDFELSESNVRLSDSLYNEMLSEMGLSISKSPSPEEKKADPSTPSPPTVPPVEAVQIPKRASSTGKVIKAIVIAAVVGFLLLAIVAAVGVAIYFFY